MLSTVLTAPATGIVLFSAAMDSIPQDFYEAAELDGAGRSASGGHITLPLIKPMTLYVVVLYTIASFEVFDKIIVMVPSGVGNSTEMIVTQIYRTGLPAVPLRRRGGASLYALLDDRGRSPSSSSASCGAMSSIKRTAAHDAGAAAPTISWPRHGTPPAAHRRAGVRRLPGVLGDARRSSRCFRSTGCADGLYADREQHQDPARFYPGARLAGQLRAAVSARRPDFWNWMPTA